MGEEERWARDEVNGDTTEAVKRRRGEKRQLPLLSQLFVRERLWKLVVRLLLPKDMTESDDDMDPSDALS